MNQHDFIDALIIVAVTSSLTALGFAIAWIRARERAIRAESRAPGLNETTQAHLEQLGHALDAVALEVERIGEAERFASRVRGTRPSLEAGRPFEPGRTHTPH